MFSRNYGWQFTGNLLLSREKAQVFTAEQPEVWAMADSTGCCPGSCRSGRLTQGQMLPNTLTNGGRYHRPQQLNKLKHRPWGHLGLYTEVKAITHDSPAPHTLHQTSHSLPLLQSASSECLNKKLSSQVLTTAPSLRAPSPTAYPREAPWCREERQEACSHTSCHHLTRAQ